MIPQTFEYTAPKTLDEALGLLAEGAKPLAGGMSLIPMMKLRLARRSIWWIWAASKDLNYIREEAGRCTSARPTTHQDVESSALVRGKCPLLAETAAHIGDVQVRNMGTIGGSVAHADPAADYPAALQALEAKIRAEGREVGANRCGGGFLRRYVHHRARAGRNCPRGDRADGGAGHRNQLSEGGAAGQRIRDRRVLRCACGSRVKKSRWRASGSPDFRIVRSARRRRKRRWKAEAARRPRFRHAAALVAEGVDANSDLHASADYRRHLASGSRGASAGRGTRPHR